MIHIERGATDNYRDGFHSVFGDDYNFIDFIINTADEVFEIYDDDVFCGGLCAFDISIKENYALKSGAYIYGAFVCERARGRGFFKLLCEHVREFYENEFYDFIFTVPADESLFSLYEHLGFTIPLRGVVSVFGENGTVALPDDTEIRDFDGDFHSLYFIHIQNDALLKTFDLFKASVADFDIKYIDCNFEHGYALFKDDMLLFASAPFVSYESKVKGLLMPITEINAPSELLCDILFEI